MMTSTTDHGVLITTPPPKAILQPRDINSTVTRTPSPTTAYKTPSGTSRTPNTAGRKNKTPGRGLFSPTLPLQARKLGIEERAEKFQLVCKLRIGEDLDGDLAELGIQEWSVDDFIVVGKLGSGGVAQVYLAEEKQSGHPVALKIQQANDHAFGEIDLHLEVSASSNNNKHPNILHMIDYFYSTEKLGPEQDKIPNNCDDDEDDDEEKIPYYLYSILEVCEGGDLYEAIDSYYANVPEPVAARYIRDAISALEHVHSLGMIHCDIKPANFLIEKKSGNLQLADFGMAVRVEEKEVLGGSPVYMAPEHLLAWKHDSDDGPFAAHSTDYYNNFDQRSDIYSLGVVLYEVLMGYLPFVVKGANNGEEEDLVNTLDELLDDDESDSCCGHPVLDLRKLDQYSSDEVQPSFVLPRPIFDGEISEEAQDLILRFLEADPNKRITLEEAKHHSFLTKHQL